ncbi:PREDICTED: uncharacterized protein LOC106808387 [Priapulus caudatus]|uniref:Uncharacterized protein LOC106808387 n=1 Tax=Priapulus caudatus TaxID=37621 RepID=A0ABM1E303_PRICU|nr:PREDICTED: uncharacterized protein LOC106808387 [Priapulus caudatus]
MLERVQLSGDEEAGCFSQQLLEVGNGRLTTTADGQVKLPFGKAATDITQLMTKVFPNLHLRYQDQDWLSERVILAAKNLAVDDINAKLLEQLPGDPTSYKSIDTVPDPDEVVHYLTEFLNSLAPSGLPPHNLVLKAQGQSLKVVGVNLSQPVFSYGQLYVGCSRVGNPNLYILSENGNTKNVVYQEALQS